MYNVHFNYYTSLKTSNNPKQTTDNTPQFQYGVGNVMRKRQYVKCA
jgi:hypothetical protein